MDRYKWRIRLSEKAVSSGDWIKNRAETQNIKRMR